MKKVYFVTGIDTDAGKSIVTGTLAREWSARGLRVITQKFVQTGCRGLSEDIETHRRIMGCGLQPEDRDGTTCPVVFTYPASPHLAAVLDGREIDLGLVAESTEKLLRKYDIVLLEGAGGLFVPLRGLYNTIDYIADHRLPVILVTSPRLGSINHTLLSLEACRHRGIEVAKVVYNLYPPTGEPITGDTRNYILTYLDAYHPQTEFIEVTDRYELLGDREGL
ncbi:dethiobiotin synthase [uncultured Alistipes sp.]|uniref:dethiobiotin synthase n=1 Tax=uncultured Alistipes sp. TaxID=538949 RepID=UPI002625DA87|nr:dethiobiotin synthase [uncultured Alistipes sp.]